MRTVQFQTMQWDRVLNTRIMRIEGDDIFHTHLDQFRSASAQSRDSLPVRLCWRLSYKNGMITLIRLAFPAMAAMIRFRF